MVLLGLAAEVLEQALLPHALHVIPVLLTSWDTLHTTSVDHIMTHRMHVCVAVLVLE